MSEETTTFSAQLDVLEDLVEFLEGLVSGFPERAESFEIMNEMDAMIQEIPGALNLSPADRIYLETRPWEKPSSSTLPPLPGHLRFSPALSSIMLNVDGQWVALS